MILLSPSAPFFAVKENQQLMVNIELSPRTVSDVLRSQDAPNKFFFYEVYDNPAAVDFHKTQDHYKAWADFKESGGTVSSVTKKADGEFVGI